MPMRAPAQLNSCPVCCSVVQIISGRHLRPSPSHHGRPQCHRGCRTLSWQVEKQCRPSTRYLSPSLSLLWPTRVGCWELSGVCHLLGINGLKDDWREGGPLGWDQPCGMDSLGWLTVVCRCQTHLPSCKGALSLTRPFPLSPPR